MRQPLAGSLKKRRVTGAFKGHERLVLDEEYLRSGNSAGLIGSEQSSLPLCCTGSLVSVSNGVTVIHMMTNA